MTRVLPLIARVLLALSPPPAAAQPRPNIVFVLTDDLSWNLVPYMPQVRQLQREGMTLRPLLRDGLAVLPVARLDLHRPLPAQHRRAHEHGRRRRLRAPSTPVEEKSTFATALQRAGYRTGLMGKYLNGYFPFSTVDARAPVRPAGLGGVGGRRQRPTASSTTTSRQADGTRPRIVHYGSAPQDYLTDVIAAHGRDFVADAVADGKPFMLELVDVRAARARTRPPRATRTASPACTPRATPLFDAPQLRRAPAWLLDRPAARRRGRRHRRDFRKRAQSVQAVDRMIGALRAQLRALGVADNTYFVFSSDNGFHLGEHRLRRASRPPGTPTSACR